MAHDDLIARSPLPEVYKPMATNGLTLLDSLEPEDILEAEHGDLERMALAALALRAEVARLRGELHHARTDHHCGCPCHVFDIMHVAAKGPADAS